MRDYCCGDGREGPRVGGNSRGWAETAEGGQKQPRVGGNSRESPHTRVGTAEVTLGDGRKQPRVGGSSRGMSGNSRAMGGNSRESPPPPTRVGTAGEMGGISQESPPPRRTLGKPRLTQPVRAQRFVLAHFSVQHLNLWFSQSPSTLDTRQEDRAH